MTDRKWWDFWWDWRAELEPSTPCSALERSAARRGRVRDPSSVSLTPCARLRSVLHFKVEIKQQPHPFAGPHRRPKAGARVRSSTLRLDPSGRATAIRNGHRCDPRAIEPVHFRDFALSSSNQFSTTISLSGVPARIIKKRRSSGATAYCGPNRRDVNPAAGKSAADRPSENRGLVFMATATRSPEAAR